MADFSTHKMTIEPFGSGNSIHYIMNDKNVSLLYRDDDGKFSTIKNIREVFVKNISFDNYFSISTLKITRLEDDGTITK
jgi:hypothetical protein